MKSLALTLAVLIGTLSIVQAAQDQAAPTTAEEEIIAVENIEPEDATKKTAE